MAWDIEVQAGGKSSEPCRALLEPLIKLAHVEDSTIQAPFELPGEWDCHQLLHCEPGEGFIDDGKSECVFDKILHAWYEKLFEG